MASTADDGVFESRIGTGTKITGKLTFRGRTKIEGDAEGEIRGEEIVIAQSAVVSAKVWATTLSVAGRVTGELVASERIELLATARAKCTINTPDWCSWRARSSRAIARCRSKARPRIPASRGSRPQAHPATPAPETRLPYERPAAFASVDLRRIRKPRAVPSTPGACSQGASPS